MLEPLTAMLRISSAALIFSGYLALIALPEQGAGVLLAPLALIALAPLGERLDARFSLYRRFTGAVTFVFTVALPLVVQALGLMEAVTVLVVFIQAHRLLHVKAAKDYYIVYLMSFFLLVAGCAQGPDAFIAVAILSFMFSAVWAFVSVQLWDEAHRIGPLGIGQLVSLDDPEVLPLPRPVTVLDRGMARSLLVVSAASILMTAVLFFVTPRTEAGIFGASNIVGIAQTGLSETVQVSDGGLLLPDTTPLMRVEFPDEPNGRLPGELYWRSATRNFFSGAEWDNLGGTDWFGDNLPRPRLMRPDSSRVARAPSGRGRLVRQSIYIDEIPVTGLPCLPYPVEVACEGATIDWESMSSDLSVRIEHARTANLTYEVVSEVFTPTPRQLREARDNYQEVVDTRDLFLYTAHSLQPRTVGLAQMLTSEQETVFDKVSAIESWLRSSAFVYTLDRPELPRRSPVDAFVNTVRRGHCELFASAMALMVRSLGIPARVALGYRGGTWNDNDRAYIVRKDMAHLWVEVYFLDYGWVIFDPSPAADDPSTTFLSNLQQALARHRLRLRMFWYRDIMGYEGRNVWSRLAQMTFGFIASGFDPEADRIERGGRLRAAWGWDTLIGLMGVVGLVAALAGLRRRKRTRVRIDRGQARAVALFLRLKRRLTRFGMRCEGRTAGELDRELRRLWGAQAVPASEVIDTYNAVRFGGRPLDDATYARLRRAIQALKPA